MNVMSNGTYIMSNTTCCSIPLQVLQVSPNATSCSKCSKLLHDFIPQHKCLDRLKKLEESKLNKNEDGDDAVFFQQPVFLNEEKVIPTKYESQENNVWYFDNGASNHMTWTGLFFSELNERITD